MERVHLIVEGRVQGVGFRHFTKTQARKHQVTGWVKNLADGTVEAVMEGDEKQIQTMIDKVRQGPAAGKVTDLKVNRESSLENFNDFSVRY